MIVNQIQKGEEIMPAHKHYALKDSELKAAKPLIINGKAKKVKLNDGEGLHLIINPQNVKYWVYEYTFNHKESSISIGRYPEITLGQAREIAHKYNALKANGNNPIEHKRNTKQIDKSLQPKSFEAVARLWFANRKCKQFISEGQKKRIIQSLESNVFPFIGKKSFSEITPKTIFSVLDKIQKRGAIETAHRVLGRIGEIYNFAVFEGITEQSNIINSVKGELITPIKKHYAAIVEPENLTRILSLFSNYEGQTVTKSLLNFLPLVFQRPGEVRLMKWADIDFNKKVWYSNAGKTKTKQICPLSDQAIQILENLKPFTEKSCFVFPSARSYQKPISPNTLRAAYITLGIDTKNEMTSHGWRATARTVLEEVLKYPENFIENQLAHSKHDANGSAYNRTKFLDDRRIMLQAWADYLDGLKEPNADLAALASKYNYKATLKI